MEHVVIVGAGFGGLEAALHLAGKPVRVTVVDRHNYHLFQPLLYQVATASIGVHDIAPNLRGVLRDADNIGFRLAAATGVDWERNVLSVDRGDDIPFDHLVLAAGATTDTLGIEGVREHTYPMKTLSDAVAIRDHVLAQFERVAADPSLLETEDGVLTFVVVGAGPTGVELCGAFSELVRDVLARDFEPHIIERARIVLVEAMPAVLPPFSDPAQRAARAALEERGVEILTDAPLEEVRADAVVVGGDETTAIPARTVIWAAGVRAQALADTLGLEQSKGQRVVVDRDLSVPGRPNVWVIGDMAAATDEDGDLYPQLAAVAKQQGKHVVRNIALRRAGRATEPFHYTDRGWMAVLGRGDAVADLPRDVHLAGPLAWLAWLGLHLILLVGYRNRASVLLDWFYDYLLADRAARTIVRGQVAPRRTPGEDVDREQGAA